MRAALPLPGQHFGDMQDQRLVVSHAPQLAFYIENAAQVAEYDRSGAALVHALALRLRHGRGDFAELDRERAAKAAAGFGVFHLLELDAWHLRQQRTRLLLDAELTQARTRVVVCDRPRIFAGHSRNAGDADEEVG